mmetsp:Transcript_17197/g.44800  ORF Transcript_17197/g.44800 Transcript_17197/m.44800 type:complete len:372 (-) Transcript_17197:86-1201(-)
MMVAATLVALSAAVGHICVIDPPQRGPPLPSPLGPGEDLCYRRTPYCGGVEVPKVPPTAYLAGAPATLLFQQNLNHFHEGKPGTIDVAISYSLEPTDTSWTTLATLDDWAANDMVTMTNFSITVDMPTKAANHAILRWRYTSHSAGEVDPANNTDAVFYNCADISLVANPDATVAAGAGATAVRVTRWAAAGCATPTVWIGTAIEISAKGALQHEVTYDGGQQAVLWQRSGPVYQAGVIQNVSTLSLYGASIPKQPPTTKPEYIFSHDGSGSCVLYGADPMYTFKFGPERNEVLVREFSEDGKDMQEWATADGEHTSIVELTGAGMCRPTMQRGPSSTTVWTSFTADPPLPEGWADVPTICKKPTLGHGIH